MKYSFIVCCYNGEEFLNRCIDSLLKQSYQNFEIIFINDGSIDNSLRLIQKYKSKKIKIINQDNRGLSYSRNKAIKNISGDYFLFVDIDDFVSINLLENINKKNNSNIDIIKFNYSYVYGDGLNKDVNLVSNSEIIKGKQALELLINSKMVFEMACIYCFNKTYWNNNKYLFDEEKYHEDFGLIPFVILSSNSILLLDDILYYYYQSNNSITRTNDLNKLVKQAYDVLFFFNKYKSIVDNKLFLSFMANAVIQKNKSLTGKDKKKYTKAILSSNVINYLNKDGIVRKLKYIYLLITLKIQ